ncbi:MAG: 4-hydroxythreonine-4-phosphate dehydrogenase PdxA [Elusimicrobia bacterium]|jgi:4-hydroxythreonine-4-phosphate dehydrogenase|nr:4-hydroxythreonine-4-phosphate dehydrogenase PdxA [Elusimicrobiota bacterium]
MTHPFLAITSGDPAGCGPWVAVHAAQDKRVSQRAKVIVVGDAWVFHKHVRIPGLRIRPITDLKDYSESPLTLNILHVPHPNIRRLSLGHPQKLSGESAALAIRTAVSLALSERVAGVVTGPVSKESLKAAGLPFPGHTEMLAALSGTPSVEMVMRAGPLITLLVTRHLPLKSVPGALSVQGIVDSVTRTNQWAQQVLGLIRPTWGVCGLNPHAGDKGLLGEEEQRIVTPAVKILRRKGLRVQGPLPADSAWAKHRAGDFNLIASLYHDQGMIPLKVASPREVINVTVGLPFVRTSPGHGTAFDLARQRPPYRHIDPEPTVQACLAALEYSSRRKNKP